LRDLLLATNLSTADHTHMHVHSRLHQQNPTVQYHKLPIKLHNQQHLTAVARSKRVCTIRMSSRSVRSKCKHHAVYRLDTAVNRLQKYAFGKCYELRGKARYKSTKVNSDSAGLLNSACSV